MADEKKKDAIDKPKSEESFLVRYLTYPVYGPIVAWHIGATVIGIGGIWYAVKKGLFRRLFGG